MPSVNVRLSLPEDNPCELFHTDTKLYPYQLRQWKYQQQPIAEHPAIARWMQAPFKEYLSLPQLDLPAPLPLKTVATGLPGEQPDAELLATLLDYPEDITSLELYLWAEDIQGVPSGLYHYNKRSCRLESFPATEGSFPADKIRQNMPENLAAVLFISGVFTRIRLQYGERGYRYMLFEAGRVIEQMLAKAETLNVSLQLMPDFFDDATNAFLDLDGVEESVLSLVGIEKK